MLPAWSTVLANWFTCMRAQAWLCRSHWQTWFDVKLEFDVVKPLKSKLYKYFVNDIYSKQIKNQPDKVFTKLNNYLSIIKVIIEVNPKKFLDAEIIVKDGIIETSAIVKDTQSQVISSPKKV